MIKLLKTIYYFHHYLNGNHKTRRSKIFSVLREHFGYYSGYWRGRNDAVKEMIEDIDRFSKTGFPLNVVTNKLKDFK